tara:strand:+ start:154 stop:447 length:294 start_codon:yes stop_codon:yes gene_type:complete
VTTLQTHTKQVTNQNKPEELTITSPLRQVQQLNAHELKHLLNLRIREQRRLAIKNRLLEVILVTHQVEAQIPTEVQTPTDRLLHQVEDLDKQLCYTD